MTRHRSFTTAAARRKADPIVWEIDGTEIRLRPSVDLVEIAEAVEQLQAPIEGNSLEGIVKRRTLMVDMIATFVTPEDRDQFAAISGDLDVAVLVEMVQEVTGEYTGTGNPTQPESSSDGSSPTGNSSTAGARPEESTLAL